MHLRQELLGFERHWIWAVWGARLSADSARITRHLDRMAPPKNRVQRLPTIHSVAESGGLSDVFVLRSAEFLGESDEKPFRPADVAEPIRVFILDYFAYELRAAIAEPFKRPVDVVHGEHDAEVA